VIGDALGLPAIGSAKAQALAAVHYPPCASTVRRFSTKPDSSLLREQPRRRAPLVPRLAGCIRVE